MDTLNDLLFNIKLLSVPLSLILHGLAIWQLRMHKAESSGPRPTLALA